MAKGLAALIAFLILFCICRRRIKKRVFGCAHERMQRLFRHGTGKLGVQIYCAKCSDILGTKPIYEARPELIQIEYQSGWLSEKDVKDIAEAMFIDGCMKEPYYPA